MRIAFDTEALLAFYLGEQGGERVKAYLEKIQDGEAEGLLNIINLTELYYILHRKDPAVAEDKEANLRSYGLKIVTVTDDKLWKEAGVIKAKHAIALVDAFAVATAKVKTAQLVTGRDKEFKGIDVEIIGIR